MENLIYIIVSYLYIAILLVFKSLRYYLSTKSCLPKSTLWKVVIFGVKYGSLMKNRKKWKISLYTMFADMLMIIQHVEMFERKNSHFHV